MNYTPITDEEAARLNQETAARDASGPAIRSARYDAKTGRVELTLRDGVTLGFPARTVKGLEEATDEQLAEVQPISRGTALDFPELDQQYQLTAMLEVLLHIRTIQSVTSSGGRARTAQKAAAARANGAKGGRPRKKPAPRPA